MPWNQRENTHFVSDVTVWGQSRPPTTNLQTQVLLKSTLTAASPLCPRSPAPEGTASAAGPEPSPCVGVLAAPISELTSRETPFTIFQLTQLQPRDTRDRPAHPSCLFPPNPAPRSPRSPPAVSPPAPPSLGAAGLLPSLSAHG